MLIIPQIHFPHTSDTEIDRSVDCKWKYIREVSSCIAQFTLERKLLNRCKVVRVTFNERKTSQFFFYFSFLSFFKKFDYSFIRFPLSCLLLYLYNVVI